ncbi:MAG: hypothetical protein J6V25_08720 [Oscillospiraceae bacterium]|nr:hypothetical protein [Oscillospiraceae bacterium]
MIYMKLSWIPYILMIAGVTSLAEGNPDGMILLLLGLAGIYIRKTMERPSQAPDTGYAAPMGQTSNQPLYAAAPIREEPEAPVAVQTPTSNTKSCIRCGTQLRVTANHCSHCGQWQ